VPKDANISKEEQNILNGLLIEFDTLDDNLLESPKCKILDEYPYYMMDEPINPESNDLDSSKKGKTKASGLFKKTPRG